MFFRSANPGAKRMDERKKAPSNKALRTLAVGRRANASGSSAALKLERSGKMESFFFFVNVASLNEFRANMGHDLAGRKRTVSDKKRDCSGAAHLVGMLAGIVGYQYREY